MTIRRIQDERARRRRSIIIAVPVVGVFAMLFGVLFGIYFVTGTHPTEPVTAAKQPVE